MISQESLKKLKDIIEEQTADIIEHPERKEDLLDMKSTVTVMCELFKLITQEQAQELLKPIEQAGDKFYKEYLEETRRTGV